MIATNSYSNNGYCSYNYPFSCKI